VECQFDQNYYFTDCDIDIDYDGNTYQSDQGLKMRGITQSANFSLDRVGLAFGNVELWMSSILLNEDIANDPVIIRVVIYDLEPGELPSAPAVDEGVEFIDGDVEFIDGEVPFYGTDFYSMIGDPAEIFSGFVTDWRLTEQTAEINLGSEFMLWRKKALRLPTPSCFWSFKGTECDYGGVESWCDQSVERCKELSNYASFGGRRWIAAVETEKVWWGP